MNDNTPFYMQKEFTDLITKPQTVDISLEVFTEVVAVLGMSYGSLVGLSNEDVVAKKLEAALRHLLTDVKAPKE